MNNTHRELIKSFFSLTSAMKSEGIIRSSKYTGDIGEYIAKKIFGLTLSRNQREAGIDAVDSNDKKYEIKFHNGEVGKNIQLDRYKDKNGNINIKFDYMYVLLTNNSNLRKDEDEEYENDFILIYEFTKKQITNIMNCGNNINKSNIASKKPIKRLDFNLKEII